MTGWAMPDKRPSTSVEGVAPPITWWAKADVVQRKRTATSAVRQSRRTPIIFPHCSPSSGPSFAYLQDYSSRRIDRKRKVAHRHWVVVHLIRLDHYPALTKRARQPLTGRDRRSLIRERTGNAVRNDCSKAAAAPATVSGEPVPHCHWEQSREGGHGRGPASQETCR